MKYKRQRCQMSFFRFVSQAHRYCYHFAVAIAVLSVTVVHISVVSTTVVVSTTDVSTTVVVSTTAVSTPVAVSITFAFKCDVD